MTDALLLDIKGIDAGYGKRQVLNGVSLEVVEGEIVGIIGPNGAGKSTILKCACGMLSPWRGEIVFAGRSGKGLSPAQYAACGITYCPQGSSVFHDLTVHENLEIGGFHLSRLELRRRIEEVCVLFPAISYQLHQKAGNLSGGEQQMLALARALMSRPKLLMLDEPSLGLSPNLVKDVFIKIKQINCENSVSVLIVEQKVREVLELCHRVYSLKSGTVAFSGEAGDLRYDRLKLKELFL